MPIRLYWQFKNFANKFRSNSVSSRKTSEFRLLTEYQSYLFQKLNSFYNYAHFLSVPKNQHVIQEIWLLLVSFVKALMYVPFLILTCLTYLTWIKLSTSHSSQSHSVFLGFLGHLHVLMFTAHADSYLSKLCRICVNNYAKTTSVNEMYVLWQVGCVPSQLLSVLHVLELDPTRL